MNKTQKWFRSLVVGSMALGVVGFVGVGQAQASSHVTFAKFQHRWHEQEWRHSHPHWNGHYYWHNNAYYFDRGYTAPAIVDNEWGTIGGGVVLNSDPHFYFSGSYGSLYPTASLNIDLGSSYRARHARALYYQHPYFWRDGVRYDRTTVTRNGTHYYRFVRHR